MPDIERELRIKAVGDTTQAQQATAELTAQVEGLAAAQAGVAPATAAATVAEQGEAAAASEAAVADQKAAAAASELAAARAREAAASKESSAANAGQAAGAAEAAGAVRGLAGALAQQAGVIGFVLIALDLLFNAWKKASEIAKEAAERVVGWTIGLRDSDVATRKAGESLEDFAARANKARDAIENAKRAQDAAAVGAIVATNDLRLLGLEYDTLQARIRGTLPATEEFTKALKSIGIVVPESFDKARATVEVFANVYETIIRERGPAAAARFADQNRIFVEKSVQAFTDAGVAIPAELQKVIDVLATVGKGAEEARKKAEEFSKGLVESAKATEAAREKVASLADQLIRGKEAFEKSTASIEAHRAATLKDAVEAEQETVKSVDAQIDQLNRLNEQAFLAGDVYRAQYAELQLKLIDARRKREELEATADTEAVRKQGELAKAFEETSTRQKAALAELGQSEQSALKVKEELLTADRNRVAAIGEAAAAETASIGAINSTTEALRAQRLEAEALSLALAEIANQRIPTAVSQLGGLDQAMTSSTGKIETMRQAAEDLFGGSEGPAQ